MLVGNKSRLVPLVESDYPLLAAWLNQPDVVEPALTSVAYPTNEEAVRKHFDEKLSREDTLLFMIEDLSTGKKVGFLEVDEIDWKNRRANLAGTVIGDKEDRGRGLGSDARRTLIRFCFEEMNLNRLQSIVFEFNKTMIRLNERMGFRLDGTLREYLFRYGRYWDALLFSMLFSDFKQVGDWGG